MRQLTRIQPLLPAGAMQTYQILAPEATHFRPASCVEVNCFHHREGWVSIIDETSELGKEQAWYIRNQSGRHFREDRNSAPGMTAFIFEAGQRCFATHQVRLDRPELYIVKGGDWRGNPTGQRRQHTRPEHWVEDFAEHQQKLADEIEKG